MAPLACDPTDLDHAGATVVATGMSLGSVISALTTALSGCAGMAGNDPVGAALGRAYDGAAAKLIDAMTSTGNGLCSIGDGVRVSAHNYALVEALSDVTGQAAGLPTPQVTGPLTMGAQPPSGRRAASRLGSRRWARLERVMESAGEGRHPLGGVEYKPG